MKKLLLLAIILGATLLPRAFATTVGFFPGGTARTVRDASSTALTDTNSLVWAGTFTNESFTLNNAQSLGANVASVTTTGGWKQFSLDTVSNTSNSGVLSSLGVSASGKVGGQVSDNNAGATQATFFDGKPLYLWVFNASTPGAATEMGIFRATSAIIPWIFPTNANGLGDSQTFSTTAAAAPTIAALGNFGSASATTLQLTNNFNVVPVPEPSTFALGLFTAVAALYARRRHR